MPLRRRGALLALSSATASLAARPVTSLLTPLVTSLVTSLTGCTLLRQPDPVPMRTLYDDRGCSGTQAPVLLVLLPGIYMALEELLQQGFVSALRQRGLAVDVLLADAHIGYVRDGSMRRRLRTEVIGQARAWGYRRIWLAGISLGGFGALAYAAQQPGEVEGVLALAPYLGRPELLQTIASAGGPLAWSKRTAPPATEDVEDAVWRWLVQLSMARQPLPQLQTLPGSAALSPALSPLPRLPTGAGVVDAPQLWLGYGSEDRFAAAHRMLAPLLPAGHTQVVPGGHDWPPWRALWAQWLDRGVLPASCVA